jgi:hypothetical protein
MLGYEKGELEIQCHFDQLLHTVHGLRKKRRPYVVSAVAMFRDHNAF